MTDTKAQVSGGFNVLLTGAIAIVIVSIVVLTGMDIISEYAAGVNETEFAEAENETVTPYHCNNAGILGCNTNPIIVPIAAGVSVLLGVVIGGVSRYMGSRDTTPEPSNVRDSDAEPITVIQHKYVQGEIESEEQLERELEWYIYPDHNDGENR